MYTEEYFDQLAICDNDCEVLGQLMRVAGLEFDERMFMSRDGALGFNLRALLAANFSSLQQDELFGERGATFLKLLHVIILKYQRTKLVNRDIISNISDLYHYLALKMSCLEEEHVIIFLMDSKNQLICEQKIAGGTSNKVVVYPGQIIKKAVEKSATAFIVVHNHPSGNPEPSELDIFMSLELESICKKLEITFHDHIIVGRDTVTSMRARGMFKQVPKTVRAQDTSKGSLIWS